MLLLAAWDVVMLRAAAVAAAEAATFDVLMPCAAEDVSGQLTTARARLTILAETTDLLLLASTQGSA